MALTMPPSTSARLTMHGTRAAACQGRIVVSQRALMPVGGLHSKAHLRRAHRSARTVPPMCTAQAQSGAAVDADNSTRDSAWPDGCFCGTWPTRDCPPTERPDTYAPPTYHGEPSDGPGSRVQVRVYMIDRFGLSRVGRMVLRKEFDAIWHVGVVVFGREYNFADKVAFMELNGEDLENQSMHGFAPSHVYEVGNTLKTQEELDDFVFNVLPQKYCINQYCSFTNNCHNFSDDLVQMLTDKEPAQGGFPQWCLDHGGNALSNLPNADAETIRLASNKIAKVMMVSFGKFNRERMKIMEGLEWTAVESEELNLKDEPKVDGSSVNVQEARN